MCGRRRQAMLDALNRPAARIFTGLGVLVAALMAAVPAQATFPGANGRIGYTLEPRRRGL